MHADLPEDSSLRQGDLPLVPRDVAMEDIVDSKFLTSDLLAPNHAAISIVDANRETSYQQERDRLEVLREEEITGLKEAGYYQADARIQALDQDRQGYLAGKAAADDDRH